MQRFQRGFTLIEVLVVVTILGVLAGLISLLVVQAQKKKYVFQTQQTITMVRTAIDRYQGEFNRPPPMMMTQFTGTKWAGLSISGNITNECNECLLVALHHPDFTTPLNEIPTSFGNTDDDIWNKVPDGSTAPEAKEILDAWGNPIVYIDKNHYEQPVTIMLGDGSTVEVHAVRRPGSANNVFYNQDSFQLISLGANGVQDEGEGDDMYNFTIEEE